MSMMICALCKVQRIAYMKLTSAFDSEAESISYPHCAGYSGLLQSVAPTHLIAKLILKLILVKETYSPSMDKTNWKFSDMNILGIIYGSMAFSVVFKMMD